MIGILGRIVCRAVTVSRPSFTTSPDAATITDWDSIDVYRGPSWVTGGVGPYQGAVPIDGTYLVTVSAQVNAKDSMNVPVEAGFTAAFASALLGMHSPAWGFDDTNETTWVSYSATGLALLAAGDPLEVEITAHDSDAALLGLGIQRVTLDLVRV